MNYIHEKCTKSNYEPNFPEYNCINFPFNLIIGFNWIENYFLREKLFCFFYICNSFRTHSKESNPNLIKISKFLPHSEIIQTITLQSSNIPRWANSTQPSSNFNSNTQHKLLVSSPLPYKIPVPSTSNKPSPANETFNQANEL